MTLGVKRSEAAWVTYRGREGFASPKLRFSILDPAEDVIGNMLVNFPVVSMLDGYFRLSVR
jgi:hypothetical protein